MMSAPFYFHLCKSHYSRVELLTLLQDTQEANDIRCRIEFLESQLEDRVLQKAMPCQLSNLTIELHGLKRSLIKLRGP
jgi:hypothetical protein